MSISENNSATTSSNTQTQTNESTFDKIKKIIWGIVTTIFIIVLFFFYFNYFYDKNGGNNKYLTESFNSIILTETPFYTN